VQIRIFSSKDHLSEVNIYAQLSKYTRMILLKEGVFLCKSALTMSLSYGRGSRWSIYRIYFCWKK